jgi:hypothetical protein
VAAQGHHPGTGGGDVNLVLGVIFLWLGGALIWVASHGTDAKTPWQLAQQLTGAMRNA